MTVRLRRESGWDVYTETEASGKWAILRDCIGQNIQQADLLRNGPDGKHPPFTLDTDGMPSTLTPIVYTNPKRMVFRLDRGQERYIVKRAYIGAVGWWRWMPRPGLSRFSRIFRLVDRSRARGSDITQPYHVVAERWYAPFRQEVWLLLGYLDGIGLLRLPDWEEHREALTDAVREMLRHDLTMDDVSLDNFLVHDGAVRTIDISCRRLECLQKAKMRVKMVGKYGLDLRPAGVADRILGWFLGRRYQKRSQG